MNSSPSSAIERAVVSYKSRPNVLLLNPEVQHYPWGDTQFIPSLLGVDNRQDRPYAELWMGAHSDLPSKAKVGGMAVPLDELIEQSADETLGPAVAREFGELPYLLKVLSAAAPLSIQAHPTKQKAREGFARENAAGIPHSARNRNYKDENHKPELITALTDFYGLRGFRPLNEIAETLQDVPEFRMLTTEFQPNPTSLRAMYETFMGLPHEQVDTVLDPLIQRLVTANKSKPFTRADREYWVLRADREFSQGGHRDRGIFAIYLLNLIHLRPGEAMYLPAGVLHAYLEGSGMEIMANSNNVLRGGLTGKHVDVQELLENVIFEEDLGTILRGSLLPGTREYVYETPTREFQLRRIEVTEGQPHQNGPDHSADILILVETAKAASVTVAFQQQTVDIRKGNVFLVPFGTAYSIRATGAATLYKATVPALVMSETTAEPMAQFRGHRPTPLVFGTSGLRGLVTDITDLEAYIDTRGFLEYLFNVHEVNTGDAVSIAGDLRPSTDSPDRSIMRAVARAIEDAGLRVENLGRVPTPALAYCALQHGRPSVMITGSHIPFDRNGIKFHKRSGEVLKEDEPAILEAVARARRAEYCRAEQASLFQDDGMFKERETRLLPPVTEVAQQEYLRRYLDFFPPQGLRGQRILFFQHSAVGRDLLVGLFRELGAEVLPAGRSEAFIPIDTEAISEDKIQQLQGMADEVMRDHDSIHAIVSTDGDSDRPLIAGIDPRGKVRFFGGDLLGIVVAEYLAADSITVPISANDAVDHQFDARGVKPRKTKVGSPYVIKAMQRAESEGGSKAIVGWEANGGFLTGSLIERDGRTLAALPTRDAALPLLAALHSSVEEECSLVELFSRLPPRFSKAGLIDPFPQSTGRVLIQRFAPKDHRVEQVDFEEEIVTLLFSDGHSELASAAAAAEQLSIREELGACFTSQEGFDDVTRINTLDGLRIYFKNGDIAHIRPSGNAPQLRIYAIADKQERADEIVTMGLKEPDGLLRKLEAGLQNQLPAGQR